MKNSCLLSTAYWGPIQYYSKFELYNNIEIEQFEFYERQSYRNRCKIYGPNGLQDLNVPVQKGEKAKVNIKDVKISYDTNWQHNHLKAIEAAYNSSPFYEFYMDDLIPLYKKRFDLLVDLNAEILNLCLEWLDIDKPAIYNTCYSANYFGDDYRNSIHPKEKKQKVDIYFECEEYIQGFELRHGFVPNLSILDLVFNKGPESRIVILNSIKNKEAAQ